MLGVQGSDDCHALCSFGVFVLDKVYPMYAVSRKAARQFPCCMKSAILLRAHCAMLMSVRSGVTKALVIDHPICLFEFKGRRTHQK